ncbi:MAG: MFS transporter [Desulfovibrio sp.]|nr:MFS transporter [Desulfovibrio sp.]
MLQQEFFRQKLACAYFFFIPSLAYGILTSRLPALKIAMQANDSQIGYTLLALGIATLCGLFSADFLIRRYNAKLVTMAAAVFMSVAMIIAGFAANYWQFTIFCLIAGLGVGLCDVGMNALGIHLEQTSKILCLSFLHACSSIGGAAGAISGSICAEFDIDPFWNFVLVLGVWLAFCQLAFRNIQEDKATAKKAASPLPVGKIPLFVCLCGALSLLCHIVEGSTAEWGSLLLTTVKRASQEEAALVFACFTSAMVVCRLFSDRIRSRFSDFQLTFFGSLIGAAGMALVLISSWPLVCLAGYAIMGVGVAPITPLLFSRAGATPSVSPGRASAVVSLFAYSGLLFFPPFIGIMANRLGLLQTLWVIVAICLLMTLGSRILKK